MIEPALLLHAAHEFPGDVSLVEAVVGSLDRVLAGLAGGERLLLRLDQLAQRRCEVRLAEDLASPGCFALLAGVRQHHPLRVRPLLQLLLPAFDPVGGLAVDRIAVGELDRRRQHLAERKPAVLGQHQHQAARCARRQRCERTVGGRILVALRAEELWSGARGRDAEAVDGDHLLRPRVVDQRLRLAAPRQHVPHGRCRRDHRAGGIHRIAAFLEGYCAGRGGERLARDRHPVAAVQRRLLGLRDRAVRDGRHGLAERLRCLCHERDCRGQNCDGEAGSVHACLRADASVRPAAV